MVFYPYFMVSSILIAVIAFLWLTHVLPYALDRESIRSTIRTEKRNFNATIKPVEQQVASLLLPGWVFSRPVKATLAGTLVVGFLGTLGFSISALLGLTSAWYIVPAVTLGASAGYGLRRIKLAQIARVGGHLTDTASTPQVPEVQAPETSSAPTPDQRNDEPTTAATEPTTVVPEQSDGTWRPQPVPPPLYALKPKARRPMLPAKKRPADVPEQSSPVRATTKSRRSA